MTDPIFSPLRKHLDRNLRAHLVGKTLGQCPRTGKIMEVRTAVFVLDPDGDPYMALHQDGWKQVVASGVVPDLAKAGYLADLSTIKSGDLVAETAVQDGRERDASEPVSTDQQELF